MEAKDTVMPKKLLVDRYALRANSLPIGTTWEGVKGIAEAQAKISFKAGIKEVVYWVNKNREYSNFNRLWQAKLNEWGIKEEQ